MSTRKPNFVLDFLKLVHPDRFMHNRKARHLNSESVKELNQFLDFIAGQDVRGTPISQTLQFYVDVQENRPDGSFQSYLKKVTIRTDSDWSMTLIDALEECGISRTKYQVSPVVDSKTSRHHFGDSSAPHTKSMRCHVSTESYPSVLWSGSYETSLRTFLSKLTQEVHRSTLRQRKISDWEISRLETVLRNDFSLKSISFKTTISASNKHIHYRNLLSICEELASKYAHKDVSMLRGFNVVFGENRSSVTVAEPFVLYLGCSETIAQWKRVIGSVDGTMVAQMESVQSEIQRLETSVKRNLGCRSIRQGLSCDTLSYIEYLRKIEADAMEASGDMVLQKKFELPLAVERSSRALISDNAEVQVPTIFSVADTLKFMIEKESRIIQMRKQLRAAEACARKSMDECIRTMGLRGMLVNPGVSWESTQRACTRLKDLHGHDKSIFEVLHDNTLVWGRNYGFQDNGHLRIPSDWKE